MSRGIQHWCCDNSQLWPESTSCSHCSHIFPRGRPQLRVRGQCYILLSNNVLNFMMTSLLHHQHDPEGTDCAPGGSDGNFIMSAFHNSGSQPNNNQFSNCSISTMQTFIQTRGQGEGECGLTYTVTSSTVTYQIFLP